MSRRAAAIHLVRQSHKAPRRRTKAVSLARILGAMIIIEPETTGALAMLHLFAAFFALIFCFGISSQPARPQPTAVPAVVDCSFTTPRGPNSPTLEQVSFGNSSYSDSACPSSPATSVSFSTH